MDDYKYNLTGKVKLVNARGYGFIIVDDKEGAGMTTDVFFHVSNLPEDMQWDEIAVGQKVKLPMIVRNGRGWQAAEQVEFVRPKNNV